MRLSFGGGFAVDQSITLNDVQRTAVAATPLRQALR